MIVLDYQKKHHKQIVQAVVLALKAGKVVVYPTDTSYGLAVDVTNTKAVQRFYKIKNRLPNKPVLIVVKSVSHAKNFAQWSSAAQKLALRYWPGPLSLILPVRSYDNF